MKTISPDEIADYNDGITAALLCVEAAREKARALIAGTAQTPPSIGVSQAAAVISASSSRPASVSSSAAAAASAVLSSIRSRPVAAAVGDTSLASRSADFASWPAEARLAEVRRWTASEVWHFSDHLHFPMKKKLSTHCDGAFYVTATAQDLYACIRAPNQGKKDGGKK
jgi:hypothetical protein